MKKACGSAKYMLYLLLTYYRAFVLSETYVLLCCVSRELHSNVLVCVLCVITCLLTCLVWLCTFVFSMPVNLRT